MLLLLLCAIAADGDMSVFNEHIWPVLSGTGETGNFTCGTCCAAEDMPAFGHVQCNSEGVIQKLSFISQVPPLNGTIPSIIASLTNLRTLMLQNNEIHGTIPPLPFILKGLFVHENKLSGTLPEWRPAMTAILVYANRLSGAVAVPLSLPLTPTTTSCWIIHTGHPKEENCFTCPLSAPLHPKCVYNQSSEPERQICGTVWSASCSPYTPSPTASPTSAPSAPTPPTLSPTAAPAAALSPLAASSSSSSSSLASILLIVAPTAAVCIISLLIALLVFLVVRRRRRRRSPRRVDSVAVARGTSDLAGRASSVGTLESVQYAAVPRRGRSHGSSRRQSRKLAPATSSPRARHSLTADTADYAAISKPALALYDLSDALVGYGSLPEEAAEAGGGARDGRVERGYDAAPYVSGDFEYENTPAVE